jgi:hypothetical protein
MSSDQITRTLQLHLRAMMLARFFQPLEFGQQVVGLFVLPIIAKQLVSQFALELRVLVKRILRRYKYPPDDPATGEYTVSVTKVLDQAELLADYWTKSK